jgi:peptidoglycan hydrolase-like protein with peptidoglycan-binding domain
MVKMISPIAVRFLSVLILTFWVGTALADKRVALIVGNSQYARISPKLVNPANDAHDLAQALANIGFDVILRTDVGKGAFDQALVEFSRKAKNADTALFYYAGHGLQHNGKNYFLPTDIEVQDEFDFNYRAISQDSILYAVGQAKSVKIVVLDACRDNPLARQFVASRGWGGGGLARIDSAEETIVAYATAPDHVANDGEGRNSPFTAALISRIKEPGLEITTMFRRVANDVYAQTGGRQQPEITSSLRTDYFLNPAESDSAAWSRVRDSTNPADFKEFIQKFPASPFAREAQFRIDLFDRIRRETEEAKQQAERLGLEAEKKRHEEAAKKEAERLFLEAEKKRQEEAARKEAERIALEAERKRQEEAARKEAERITLEAEKKRQEVAAKMEAERLAFEAQKKRQEDAARKEAERLALEAEMKRQEEAAAKQEAERLALEAEKKRQEDAAKNEAERLTLEAEAKRQEEAAAKKEAERLALEAEKKRQEETARKEAGRLQEENRAAEERKIAAREEEDRKKQEIEREKQRIARICEGDQNTLQELTTTLQAAAIEKLANDTACPALKPAIETALKKVARAVKQTCDSDRRTLAALKDKDLGALKTAVVHMTCEPVRAETQRRLAKLEDELKREQSVCADEKTKLDAIDGSAAGARQQYVEFLARAACPSLSAEVSGTIKKIDSRVKAAQTELARLGCYSASINGKFDDATKRSLALYHSKKGSLADGDHLSDGILSELKQQNLGLCPEEKPAAPVIATPVPEQKSKEQANKEEEARPEHKRHKIEKAAREEQEPASAPPRHKTHSAAREEEPVSRRPRHRTQSATREEESSAPRSRQRAHLAPRMPPRPTAEAGSAHSTAIGVGF